MAAGLPREVWGLKLQVFTSLGGRGRESLPSRVRDSEGTRLTVVESWFPAVEEGIAIAAAARSPTPTPPTAEAMAKGATAAAVVVVVVEEQPAAAAAPAMYSDDNVSSAAISWMEAKALVAAVVADDDAG